MHGFSQYKTIQIPIGGRVYTLYVADDNDKRVQGLSDIRHLSRSEGMFFKHNDMGCRSYTMENTHIPLRIIFIDEDFNIVNEIVEQMKDEKFDVLDNFTGIHGSHRNRLK